MILISPRNFILPFQNKIAMGAILVIAVLVLAARFSGSSLAKRQAAGRPTAAGYEYSRNVAQGTREEGVAGGSLSRPSAAAVQPAPQRDDFLRDLLAEEDAPPAEPTEAAGPKGLNDIKKSLGLE
jgi:hypothetical protein